MIGQLSLPLISAAIGGLSGIIETIIEAKHRSKTLELEANRDASLARDGELEKFYKAQERSDAPKKIVHSWTDKKGNTHEKISYKYIHIPARRYRFLVVGVFALAYSLLLLWCGIDADRIIWSFPAEPQTSKWFNFFGFSLIERSTTPVYQLTLGGLILPLASPVVGFIARWVTGVAFDK